jgi:hypothetical protein
MSFKPERRAPLPHSPLIDGRGGAGMDWNEEVAKRFAA